MEVYQGSYHWRFSVVPEAKASGKLSNSGAAYCWMLAEVHADCDAEIFMKHLNFCLKSREFPREWELELNLPVQQQALALNTALVSAHWQPSPTQHQSELVAGTTGSDEKEALMPV